MLSVPSRFAIWCIRYTSVKYIYGSGHIVQYSRFHGSNPDDKITREVLRESENSIAGCHKKVLGWKVQGMTGNMASGFRS